ncbi:sugar transferase [Spirosoma sp. BT702]|uniref:Sugar transferase n=1 Tax=Spirosoma profusum TaxID=2771354 RepID=A0A927AS40_9BACT|nr:sugar transferase [Spirosoma profusum]MBD2700665.1 sugar transferase [Spirosoma profusum]
MSYNQYSLSDEGSLSPAYHDAQLDIININSKVPEISSTKIQEYLTKFSPRDSWKFIQVNSIKEGRTSHNSKDIFIDDIVVKTDDPNFIFNYIRETISTENYFAFRTATAENLKTKLQDTYSPFLYSVYYPFYFLLRRLIPKLKGFRKICRLLEFPVDMSKAEIIGRLIYKGFKIIDLLETNYETILITQVNPSDNPSASKPIASEGFIFTMNRLGKNGKNIVVYKLRTMHPYAEYVLDYLHKAHGLDIGGKFKNDFRISTTGRTLRKYWIDEIPMLYNLLKGDIKLVGVRPISAYYFCLYPAEAQAIRHKFKPGLLPPFYADMPGTFDEIVQSEMNYLHQYEKAPFKTDVKYLLKIATNILFKNARSK